MPALSAMLERFSASGISEIFSLAVRLRAEGRDIVDLSIGELDFDTPPHVSAAGVAAIERGDTRYTSVDGTAALKRSICAKFGRDNDLEFEPEQVVVASGAKPLLFHALQAILDPGDEVVLPTPCWTSYPGMVRLAGGEPRFVPPSRSETFKLIGEDLRSALGPRTRCVLLNSPGNPSGAVYAREEIAALAAVLMDRPDVWLISDDIYERIVFDGARFVSALEVEPRLAGRCLVINGVSKSHAMTGWRIGYAAGPRPLVAGIVKIMSQSVGSPSSISQSAAIAALEGPQDFQATWRSVLQRRCATAFHRLAAVPGLSCTPAEGAFYLYPGCGALLGGEGARARGIGSSTDLALHLLEEHGVAVVPGAAFGADPHFRVSFAVDDDRLREGCDRIANACAALMYGAGSPISPSRAQ